MKKANKPLLAAITPVKHPSPELRKEMYRCVDMAANTEDKVVGYAFVSIHEKGSFIACFNIPGAQAMDVPEMVKTRLLANITNTLK